MPRVCVIAIGNPLRCDDGLAWHAADQLQSAPPPPDLTILKVHQLTPEIAQDLSAVDLAIFVDASAAGAAGELHVQEVKPGTQPNNLTHQATPAGVLALAAILFGKCPRALLVSLAAKSFDHGDSLSPEVMEKLPHLIRKLQELIADLRDDVSLGSSRNR
ncbi:MAG TPA: hydrogenase maturation protease [Terriglobales bacterium]